MDISALTPCSDFYSVTESLPPHEREVLERVRRFMAEQVMPIATRYWLADAFPFDVLPQLRELGIGGLGLTGHGCAGGSTLLEGFVVMEMARVDPSFATFYGVHNGLAMGAIHLGGSEEQKARWLPTMASHERIGCFALTEPMVGSGVAGGLTTTARREGDAWFLNGQKKWIGNATWCDLSIIWARDEADQQVKGFVVENHDAVGFRVDKIDNKAALRIVQNGLITMEECRVPEIARLQQVSSFRDTAKVLRMTRAGVAWMATGCAMGAYELALAYAVHREQFGRPIAAFQLIQDLLVKMLSNITACQCMVVRLSQLQDTGRLLDQHASLAKAFCTSRMRETVAYAREVLGANGILLDEQVARFFADAEALYSYEGTREINTLIVGKAITGHSAFV